MGKAKFKKNEKVLQVKNVGGTSKIDWVVKEVEIFSCGMKQIILKQYLSCGTPFKGDKYTNCFEQFFKLDDTESAEKFRLQEETHSKKIEQKRLIRLGR